MRGRTSDRGTGVGATGAGALALCQHPRPMDARATIVAVVLAAAPAWAAPAHARGEYESCPLAGEALVVEVHGAACAEGAALAERLAGAAAGEVAERTRAGGWSPLRAAALEDGAGYDLVAVAGRRALRLRLPGAAPDLDGWAAGRELIFARRRLVGGRPAPRGAVLCTSAFLVRLGRSIGGLSAAHCGGLRRDGTTHRRNAALRRPPQPGIVVGRVQRNVARRAPLDALVVPVPSGPARPSASVVDRGVARPPWFVAGVGRPRSGRRVCYSGRTSGADQCGRIVGRRARSAERVLSRLAGTRVRCTTITAREGDSGGPVYTAPRRDGTVHAIGITTLVVGLRARMCFTPIRPVLRALRGRLLTYRGTTTAG